jgi:hypothetical protein
MRVLLIMVVALLLLPYVVNWQDSWTFGERYGSERYGSHLADPAAALRTLQSEGKRARELAHRRELLVRRFQTRTIEQWIAGKITFAEAMTELSTLPHHTPPPGDGTRETDKEQLCRHVLRLAKELLAERKDAGAEVISRLEREMTLYLRNGQPGVNSPKSELR